ncbi:MAG: hypothetical protein QM621_09235 [Aeromicrobium sp.]|uniref:hypothetical protein n=1 Tax=Aeromicrobium sp. TaxID=1871063 RepID=UPI0039E5E3C7
MNTRTDRQEAGLIEQIARDRLDRAAYHLACCVADGLTHDVVTGKPVDQAELIGQFKARRAEWLAALDTLKATASEAKLPSSTPTCDGWNDQHDCGLPTGHVGDHECVGCGDVWNRGEWDEDADEWLHERPEQRCMEPTDSERVSQLRRN